MKAGTYLLCLENDSGFSLDKIKAVVHARLYMSLKCLYFYPRQGKPQKVLGDKI